MAQDQLHPGDLMSFLVAAQTIQKSLAQLGIMFGTYVRGISAGARVFEVSLNLFMMLKMHFAPCLQTMTITPACIHCLV